MKKTLKALIALTLVACMMAGMGVPAYACEPMYYYDSYQVVAGYGPWEEITDVFSWSSPSNGPVKRNLVPALGTASLGSNDLLVHGTYTPLINGFEAMGSGPCNYQMRFTRGAYVGAGMCEWRFLITKGYTRIATHSPGVKLNVVLGGAMACPQNGVHSDGYWYIRTDPVDIVPQSISISASTTTPTNQDVSVAADISDYKSYIAKKWALANQTTSWFSSNGTSLGGTIFNVSANGIYTVFAEDASGNKSVQTITITIIDKVAPVITLSDYDTSLTNGDITVTASTNEGSLNAESHTFIENGSFTFVATDAAENQSFIKVTITIIEKVPPVLTISGPVVNPVAKTIIYTANSDIGTLNANSHTFTDNGTFEFIAASHTGLVCWCVREICDRLQYQQGHQFPDSDP